MPDVSPSGYRDLPVLVTGAGGTVGHHLALRLAGLGARVRGIDNASPGVGYRAFHRELLAGRIDWMDGDLNDPAACARAVEGARIVFHLAGNGSHAAAMAEPLLDLDQNLRATLVLLESLRRAGTKPRLVLGGTRQLYGRATRLPVDEREPVKIVDVNAVHKQAAEEMARLYHRVHGLPAVILRLTNVFGPGMRIADSRQVFYGGWVRALLEGRPFEVWGGTQIRDLLHVADAAEAFVRAGAAAGAAGEIFNIGSGTGYSLREIADLLVRANGSGEYAVREIPESQRSIDIGDYVTNIEKARSLLGWSPGRSLPDAAAETLEYYRRNGRHYV